MTEEGAILERPIRLELESRYLAYALSTIISRSLPDVRDGLKPVHRRILYAMRALHLDPAASYKKSARVVGDVIGKFHPHGDQAAYDAMVRMAQNFALRYPMIEGQGNFGNIDGDGAAAMRYTEARLTPVAMALMENLDQETVSMRSTYDGSQQEPVVFPSRFPNLLANGSTGIAVGMSTAIPPHNVGEIIDACLILIQEPEAELTRLLEVFHGPDFPTGGFLVASFEERQRVYSSGRGSFRLRCRWHQENKEAPKKENKKRKKRKKHAGISSYHIVITEIPYHVQKSRLIERIAHLVVVQKSPWVADVRDESTDVIRIVIEPRNDRLDPQLVMAYLFKHTELETRTSVNLNVITHGDCPEVMDLKQILRSWMNHRFEVYTRRARYESRKNKERQHLLSAYLTVHLNIDEVIAIIKEHDDPAPVLMERFQLDKLQAGAVLNMRLRALRRLEEMAIRKEIDEKEARLKVLNALLSDDAQMWSLIRGELIETREMFADPRRTELTEGVLDEFIKPEDIVRKDPVTVLLSKQEWVRRIEGHGGLDREKFKKGDALQKSLKMFANETLSFLTASGRVFSILADQLPVGGKGVGKPFTMLFDTGGQEDVIWMMAVESDLEYFVTTRMGWGFRMHGTDLIAGSRNGKQAIVYRENDQLLNVMPVTGDCVASITTDRRFLVCRVSEFPLLKRGRGVRIHKLKRSATLVDSTIFEKEQGVWLESKKRTRHLTDVTPWFSQRAMAGTMLPHGFLGSGALFCKDKDKGKGKGKGKGKMNNG